MNDKRHYPFMGPGRKREELSKVRLTLTKKSVSYSLRREGFGFFGMVLS
jgi:hypothetical protein